MMIFALAIVFIAITYLFGILYAAVSRANKQAMITAYGWTGFCILGCVGVPFHELSHLVTALLFNHDVTEFALFRPIKGREDGQLGYVHHRYNRNSLYQTTGNFFIGAAPMISGAGLLTLLYRCAVPETQTVTFAFSYQFLCDVFTSSAKGFISSLCSGNIFAILSIVAAFLICPHIGMSGADFKNTIAGTLFLLSASIVVPYVINANAGISYTAMYSALFSIMVAYVYALIVGFVISLVLWALIKITDIFV